MRLNYKVLWFEDEKEWYESIVPFIQDFLTENGFKLSVERYRSGENINAILENNDFDLVLVDYLLLGKTGDTLIEDIRAHKVFTEIVFYSQRGEQLVRDIMKEKGVDGVYCAGGLVLATVSELDVKMEGLITEFFEKDTKENSDRNKTILKKKTFESQIGKYKQVEEIDEINEIHLLISKLDSYSKWRAIMRLCGRKQKFKAFKEIFKDYDTEVIKVRNVLAHLPEDPAGDKALRSSLPGYESFVFNDEECLKIRKNIWKHEENLNTLKSIIE
jgi:CheY-like chemotaxis protein